MLNKAQTGHIAGISFGHINPDGTSQEQGIPGSKIARCFSWKGICLSLEARKTKLLTLAQPPLPPHRKVPPPAPISPPTRGPIPPVSAPPAPPPKNVVPTPVRPPMPPAKRRILTLDDVPSHLWKPNPDCWPGALEILKGRSLDSDFLEELRRDNVIWAVSPYTLAAARYPLGQSDRGLVGATLSNLADLDAKPQVIVPEQGGLFWLGRPWTQSNSVVVVASPIEALAYRWRLHLRDPDFPPPLIVSADADLPSVDLIRQVAQARKGLVIATHTPLKGEALARALPELLVNNKFPEWLSFDQSSDDLQESSRATAWTRALEEEARNRARARAPGDEDDQYSHEQTLPKSHG